MNIIAEQNSLDNLRYLLLILAILIPIAVFVYWVGQRWLGRQISSRNLEAKGRRWGSDESGMEKSLRELVEHFLHQQIITPMAELRAGPCMVRGRLLDAEQHLGGKFGQECVWRNRLYGRREMAVAAEKVMIEDASGKAVIQNLETAVVIASHEKFSHHHTSISLYLGDLVEVIGWFKPAANTQEQTSKFATYGVLGANGRLYVRLCERMPQDLTL